MVEVLSISHVISLWMKVGSGGKWWCSVGGLVGVMERRLVVGLRRVVVVVVEDFQTLVPRATPRSNRTPIGRGLVCGDYRPGSEGEMVANALGVLCWWVWWRSNGAGEVRFGVRAVLLVVFARG